MRCETCIFSDDIFANGLCKWIRMLLWFSVRNFQNFTLMFVAIACHHFLFTSIWCVSIARWMCSSTKMFSIPINYINVCSSVQHLIHMNSHLFLELYLLCAQVNSDWFHTMNQRQYFSYKIPNRNSWMEFTTQCWQFGFDRVNIWGSIRLLLWLLLYCFLWYQPSF